MIRIVTFILAALVVAPQAQAQTRTPAPISEVSIYFERDSDRLSIAGTELIDAYIGLFRARRPPRVYVEGHTSTHGDDAHNADLSLRRAMTVRDALVARGIPASWIAVDSFGERNPARPTADGVHEPLNDRVVVRAPVPSS